MSEPPFHRTSPTSDLEAVYDPSQITISVTDMWGKPSSNTFSRAKFQEYLALLAQVEHDLNEHERQERLKERKRGPNGTSP